MKTTLIDMNTYARRAHFDYFRSLAYPYVGVTAEVDITDFRRVTKQKGCNFFHSFLWCTSQVQNNNNFTMFKGEFIVLNGFKII